MRAFSNYFHATDLVPGIVYYPAIGLGAPILTIITTVVLPVKDPAHYWMTRAAIAAIAHVLATSGAISNALKLRWHDYPDDVLQGIFNRFARWNAVRAPCLALAFVFSLTALL